MWVVYPLIRLLQIDPDEVFYNNGKKKSPKVEYPAPPCALFNS